MRDVVVYLARALVDEPDRVTVEELHGGRGGRTVKALRRVVKACAPKGQRVEVEVLAEGE